MTAAGGRSAPVRMRAEVIAVGSEMLTPTHVDTNSLFITERLNEIGIDLQGKAVAGDDRGVLKAIVSDALGRSDLLILTGGLGPTDDDLTRDVVADLHRTAARVSRAHLRSDRKAIRGPRARDARDQPAPGNGTGGRGRAAEQEWNRPRPLDRTRNKTDCPAAWSAARAEADVRSGYPGAPARSLRGIPVVPPRIAHYRTE